MTRPTMDKALEAGAWVDDRDVYEVANQLEGYVGPDTPDDLAKFLLREGKAAARLADEIVRLRAAALPATDTNGLVKRLRARKIEGNLDRITGFGRERIPDPDCQTAADRIEALERENASLRNAHLPEGTVSALLAAKNAGEAADEYRLRAEKAEAQMAEAEAVLAQIASMVEWQIGVPIDSEAASEHARVASAMTDAARSYLERNK